EEEKLLDLVDRAVAAQVLEETTDGAAVRFVHALIRETLYEGMLATRRRAWHRAIGESLVAAHDPDPDLVAHHFGAAGDGQAGAWFARAGLRAQRAGAWQIAGERYAMALTLVPDTEATASERGWLNLARARMEAYNPLSAAPYLVKAAQIAERVGDRVLAAVVACFHSLSRYSVGDMRGGIAEMEATVAALQSLSAEERTTLRDRREWIGWALDEDDGAGQLADFLAYAGRLGEARAIAERVVAAVPTSTGRHSGAGRAHADALFALAAVAAMDGMPDAARHRMRQSWRAYDDLGAYDEATRSLYIEALWINGMYPLEDADARARLQDDLLRAWAKTSVSLMPQFSDDLMRLPFAGIAGEWALLRQYADHFPLGGVILEIIPRVVLASVAYAQGDVARVWALVDEVLPDGAATEPGGTNFFTALVLHRFAARLAMDATDLTAARAWIAAHERWLAWSGAALGQAESNLLWAHYHRASGDAAQAEERAREALAQATAPRQPLVLLATHRFLAERATAAGRYAEADEHLGDAALLAQACGAPYERALTLLARAERRAATGDASAALTLLDEGRAILTPLGAQPALARADVLTARLAATVVAPPPPSPDKLTAREVDVLRLLAEGRSNRAIGEALGINARTAERHITNVYRKIDVYSRAEAAAYAVRHNLL
ncbi:MAG: LuxR C-terminal-related transcriptional regulator, partial [Thermomicrobia bacterium]|nr:LuxR C-terminal-related transcriptional regulator [Thermomicrobia bacterium]